MYAYEPVSVAPALTVVAILIAASVVLSHASQWIGVPVVPLFLALGMLAGQEGLGHIPFRNYRLSFDLGTAALVLILFDGGLNTPLTRIQTGIRPAAALATAGVAGTAALVSLGARLLGFSRTEAIAADTRALIANYNNFDMALYQYAAGLFSQMIAKYQDKVAIEVDAVRCAKLNQGFELFYYRTVSTALKNLSLATSALATSGRSRANPPDSASPNVPTS